MSGLSAVSSSIKLSNFIYLLHRLVLTSVSIINTITQITSKILTPFSFLRGFFLYYSGGEVCTYYSDEGHMQYSTISCVRAMYLSSSLFTFSLIFGPSSTKVKLWHNVWHMPNIKDEMRRSGELQVFTLSSPIFRDWSPLSIFFLGFTNSSLHLVL